ncbi:Calcineurin-like phosphoesterase superfamily domain protein [Candidatus Gugararchaeum adminiculabundum]|nr:Calcineurin-like phosphoesterase superfamily domain protein [Candidatus Gugararchaeum adminiculabundum]
MGLENFEQGRTLLLADNHENTLATRLVLEDARQRGGFDHVIILGDLVDGMKAVLARSGRTSNPNDVILLMREFEAEIVGKGGEFGVVAGNHDKQVLVVEMDLNRKLLNGDVWRIENGKIKKTLAPENLEWLAQKMMAPDGNFVEDLETRLFYATHQMPRHAREAGLMEAIHLDRILEVEQEWVVAGHRHPHELYEHGEKKFVRIPSVGGLRSVDGWPGYAIYDARMNQLTVVWVTERWQSDAICRVIYGTQRQSRNAGGMVCAAQGAERNAGHAGAMKY